MQKGGEYSEYAARLEEMWEKKFALYFEFMFNKGDNEGLTHVQTVLLEYLLNNGNVTVSAVAEFMGVTMAAASSLLDRLDKGGLLVRNRSDTDRRVVYASLTPLGREVIERFIVRRRSRLEMVIARMGHKHVMQYLEAQNSMLEALEDLIREKEEQEA
ncbi:MAG: MarR family winged helix-turn-helix transcriptional regulator [Bacillota bacterium]